MYLIVVNPETGARTTSYAIGVHGNSMSQLKKQAKKDYPGQIMIEDKDGNLWLEFNDDKIWDGEKLVDKPPYIPTAAEIEEAKLKQLDAEYANKLAEAKQVVTEAVTIEQDNELADELRSDYQDIKKEYIEKRGAING
ncbi:hypothetical protein [Veillonella sp.]|uniref:hypothetical protein n=1 Tax=Veillonella sp. TaxID=1926307 RepID=UPI0025CCDC9D|nr:hypothetical protein [Veillonella sp.]